MPLDYRYELSDSGTLPIGIDVAKKYLKIDSSVDNSVIKNLIATITQWGERHTGRDFRVNTWKLTLDCFEDRFLIRKAPIATISSVKYTVTTLFDTTIAATVYQFKQGNQWSEVILRVDQVWPSDLDTIEGGIQIEFVTKEPRFIEQYRSAMLQHLAYLYENRGDCEVDEAAMKSGAIGTYGTRIAQI